MRRRRWKHRFAFLPVYIDGEVVWLEEYMSRQMPSGYADDYTTERRHIK